MEWKISPHFWQSHSDFSQQKKLEVEASFAAWPESCIAEYDDVSDNNDDKIRVASIDF